MLALPSLAASPRGIRHIVEPGQTLFRISLAYGVPVRTLMEANRLASPNAIAAGQRLFVPGASRPIRVEPYRPLSPGARDRLEASLSEEGRAMEGIGRRQPPVAGRLDAEFAWPITGPISSPFGPRGGRLHAGIDIASPYSQEVKAAADGEVIYAAESRGLGKTVVIRHARDHETVYAHLSILIAREGESVRQGQGIGGVGATGNATGPHLHFEIRRRDLPLNPRDLLPMTIEELLQEVSRGQR